MVEQIKGRLRTQWPLLLMLGAFVVVAGAYSVINPLHEASDELRHFRFVRVLAATGNLPVQGQEPARSQSHHPPLYYAFSAALTFWIPNQGEPYLDRPENPFWGYRYWEVGTDNKNMYLHGADEDFPWYGVALAAHLARLVNVGLGALTVGLTAAIMFTLFPEQPSLGYGAAGLIAFNPMFLYMSGAVNNDVAAAAGGAAVTLWCARILRDGLTRRWLLGLGLVFGLALMAKFNVAYFLVLIEVVLLYRAFFPTTRPDERRFARGLMSWLQANLLVLGLTVLIAGWWFVRNQLLYGDPTGFKAVTELWGVRSPGESVELAWLELPNVWSSLWGRFGYGQIPLPNWFYSAVAWFAAGGGLGLVVAVGRAWHSKGSESTRLLVGAALLLLSALGAFCVLFAYMLVSPAGSMGRFFFPGLPALVGLVFLGWWQLVGVPSSNARFALLGRSLPGVTSAFMLLLALWALFGYLAPAYAQPAEVDSADVPHNLGVTLSDPDGPLAELLGYELDAQSLRPGDRLSITLYWRALRPATSNYVLFVHLLDELGVVVAQRDTYPGLGNYFTSQWRPDHMFAETYRLELPATAYAPATITPQVGLYSRDWNFRLDTDPLSLDNAVKLAALDLEPADGQVPNPLNVNFGDRVKLVGYQTSPRAVRPGDEVSFQLYWQAERPVDQNYRVFLHVMDAEGQVRINHDARPERSMLDWVLDTAVLDERVLTMPADLPPGMYQVELGVWSTEKGRLPIIAQDGHWVDDKLLLSPMQIAPEGEP